jgi:hypothetical protein
MRTRAQTHATPADMLHASMLPVPHQAYSTFKVTPDLAAASLRFSLVFFLHRVPPQFPQPHVGKSQMLRPQAAASSAAADGSFCKPRDPETTRHCQNHNTPQVSAARKILQIKGNRACRNLSTRQAGHKSRGLIIDA